MGRIVYPIFKAFDANGKPLVGGKVRTYDADSDIKTALYADYSKSDQSYHENPVVLNADGEAKIFWHDKYVRQYSQGLTAQLTPSGDSSGV